ncbi:hypothetical protein DFJ58DRAFT_745488 [Suillus subalutaceus]|uniref:uncharacterized protein n=1 Tax=Suillus subalutaceus TaxID=48586 RepID=UPI001B8686AB|nr:uncharacterized protein DFJ58DRAFT_745488 [Suillus subalutaceus]KAG1855330.1 hypothetical protein DFJ58DRAFT_745488 [Suillus subalutaceus]
MKPEVGFLSLAEELWFYILSFLSCQDILHCTSVCKALRQMYMFSSELQYIVELSGQRLLPVPNTDNLTPVSQRLQLLRDRAHAWLKFDIHSFKTTTMPKISYDQETFLTDGHFYFWNDTQNSATIIPTLPKPSQQAIERNWSPRTSCINPYSTNLKVFMDPAQNLIAVVYIDYAELRHDIDLRALDSDRVHPLAAGRTLFLSELLNYGTVNEGIEMPLMTLKGCGRYIALQRVYMASVEDEDGEGHLRKYMSQLEIWDWQHSTTSSSVLSNVLRYPAMSSTDFCFLENNRLLVVIEDLKLYSIEDMAQAPQLLACFLPPLLLSNVQCLFPMDDIEHSAHLQTQARQMMYTPDPANQLLCLIASDLVFIISTRIFFVLDGIAVAMPIPWNHWGPSITRVLEHPNPSRCKIHVRGNRVLQSFKADAGSGQYVLRLMDFSPLAATNRRGLGRVVKEPSTIVIAKSTVRSGASLTTSLPYVEVVSDRRFEELQNIWLERDRICLLNLFWEYTVVNSRAIRRPLTRSSRLEVIDL